jgi:phage repressor protein C with HTH and peptisase S24 domain
MVREVDISYAMGDGAVVADYPDTGLLPFGRNFLAMVGIRSSDFAFICRGQGDSMAPTIYDRDMVMIDTSRNRVTMQDQIWALTVAGAGMIKRIRPLPEGRVMVLSDNPLVPEQVYDADDVYVVGKVVWIGRAM